MGSHSKQTSKDKLRQVILFFLERINNMQLGRTKLMKLLYFVDFDHYESFGRSITGAVYRKLPHGPYPKDAEKLIEEMKRLQMVQEIKVRQRDYTQHRLITLNSKFDPSLFSGEEMQTLEKVAAAWADASASQIEAATHNEAPWAATETGKTIDYEMAEYRRPIGFEALDAELSTSRKLANYVASLA